MKLVTLDPVKLILHPQREDLFPPIDYKSPEWISFLTGLDQAGAKNIPPIVVVEGSRVVMKGWRRVEAALILGWETIYATEQPESHITALIIDSLLGHRDMSRGAKVYIALGVLKDFVESAEQRRLDNLRYGGKMCQIPNKLPKHSDCGSGDIESFCKRLGIHSNTYFQAVQVRKKLDANADLKAKWEPTLLSGECSLWNVNSGANEKTGSGGLLGSRKVRSHLLSFATLAAKSFAEWNPQERQDVLKAIPEAVDKMPAELLEAVIESGKASLKKRK